MDLNQLMASLTGAAQQRTAQIDQATAQLAGINQQATQQGNVQLDALQQAATLAGKAATAEAALKYQVSKAQERNIALAGLDPDQANNSYVQALAEFDAAEQRRKAIGQERTSALRQYEQLSSASLLTDPLGYIAAQLQLPSIAARHNSLLSQEQEAEAARQQARSVLESRVSMVRERNSIGVANTAAAANDLALQVAEAKRQEAIAGLAAAKAENLSREGVRTLELIRLQGEKYQVQDGIINKTIGIGQWQAQREMQRQQAEALAEERKRRNTEATKDAAAKAAYFSDVRVMGAALGYDNLTEETFMRLPKHKQQLLNDAVARMRFGNTLYEGLVTVEALGNKAGMAASNPGLDKFAERASRGFNAYLEEVRKEETKAAAMPGYKPRKTEELQEEAGARMQEDLELSAHSFASPRALNSERYDTLFNPYKPEFLELAKAPALANNRFVPLITKLAEPLGTGATNLPGKSINQLFDTAAQQIANGTLDPETAARDWVALHQHSAQLNKHLYQYNEFGLKTQSSAVYSLPPPSSWYGSEIKLDGMDFASTKKAFAQRAMELKRNSSTSNYQTFGIFR